MSEAKDKAVTENKKIQPREATLDDLFLFWYLITEGCHIPTAQSKSMLLDSRQQK